MRLDAAQPSEPCGYVVDLADRGRLRRMTGRRRRWPLARKRVRSAARCRLVWP